jgi:hypothetical protein
MEIGANELGPVSRRRPELRCHAAATEHVEAAGQELWNHVSIG